MVEVHCLSDVLQYFAVGQVRRFMYTLAPDNKTRSNAGAKPAIVRIEAIVSPK